MAAPDSVPTDPTQRVRVYTSPPRRSGSWRPARPGDLPGGQPGGSRQGSQGPDQGYIFKLVPLFDDVLFTGGLSRGDVVAGCVGVALKRAAQFGRAPVVHDLRIAYTVFGFLNDDPDEDLVAFREHHFDQVESHHHYSERREIVDLVSNEVLALSPDEVTARALTDWRKNVVVP